MHAPVCRAVLLHDSLTNRMAARQYDGERCACRCPSLLTPKPPCCVLSQACSPAIRAPSRFTAVAASSLLATGRITRPTLVRTPAC